MAEEQKPTIAVAHVIDILNDYHEHCKTVLQAQHDFLINFLQGIQPASTAGAEAHEPNENIDTPDIGASHSKSTEKAQTDEAASDQKHPAGLADSMWANKGSNKTHKKGKGKVTESRIPPTGPFHDPADPALAMRQDLKQRFGIN